MRNKIILAVLLFASAAYALIEKLHIEDDERSAFHIESFGYDEGGHFEVLLESFKLMIPEDYKKPADGKYKIALVLEHSNSDAGRRIEETAGNTCYHDTKKDGEGVWIISLASRHDWQKMRWVKQIETPGYYHLYFSNCEPNTHASFELTLTEYNIEWDNTKNYLSAGEAPLPAWAWVLFVVYMVEAGIWITFLTRQPKDQRKTIHHLMTVVIVFKILATFFEAFRLHTLKTEGVHDAWSVFFYIFSFLRGMMMFAVIVLIGTGWSYLKPYLTDRDKNIMLVVMVIETMVQIAWVIIDETAPGSAGWLTWQDLLHLLDMICCCMILLPIVWSIRHLRQAAAEDSKDGKAARSIARLKSFRTFYLLVVSYVYFTRIIVYLLEATLPFELTWLSTIFSEIANIVFYAITGYLFRPQSKNPYLPVDNEDLDEIEADRDGHSTTEMQSV